MAARAFHQMLQEQGQIDKREARAWLTEQFPEIAPQRTNFVLSYGTARNRKWWFDNGQGMLILGPKPSMGDDLPPEEPDKSPEVAPEQPAGLSSDVKKPPLLDPGSMAEPRDQFYTIAMNIGIAEKAARTTAYSCWNTAEMYDPTEAWQAILQSPEIMPSQKKRLWRNWCSWAGIKIPEELAVKVEQQYSALGSTSRPAPAATPPLNRRFIAVKGEVLMVEPDDPSGMPFSEALRTADGQLQKMAQTTQSAPPVQPNANDVVVALIHESGENQRASMDNQRSLLEVLKPDSSSQTSLLLAHLDNQRRETDLRFQNMEEIRRKDAELAQVREESRWREAQDREDRRQESLNRVLEQLAASSNQRRGPFDALEELAPGFMQRIVDNLFNPSPKGNELTISLPEGKMSLDDYERYSAIQSKREVVQMVRQRLPEIVEMGKDFALATRRAAEPEVKEEPVPAPPAGPIQAYCMECLRVMLVPQGFEEFSCPHCGALQNLAGEIIRPSLPPSPEEDLEASEERMAPRPLPESLGVHND